MLIVLGEFHLSNCCGHHSGIRTRKSYSVGTTIPPFTKMLMIKPNHVIVANEIKGFMKTRTLHVSHSCY